MSAEYVYNNASKILGEQNSIYYVWKTTGI